MLIMGIWFTIYAPAVVGCFFSLGWSISFTGLASQSLKSSQVHLSLFCHKNILNHLVSLQLEPVAQYLAPAWLQMHISSLAGAVWRPGITNIFLYNTELIPGAESQLGFLSSHSVSECLCSLKSYFFLWYHSFCCRSGIAIFPGGYQIWFINDSTISWSYDTCPLVNHVTVTSNEKRCNWPTSCTVWQSALLCRTVCGVLSKGMISRSEAGKSLLRIKCIQSCCRALI